MFCFTDWTSYDFTHMSIPRYIMFVGALLNVLGVLFGLIGFISKSSNDNTASKYYCLLKTEGIFYILGGKSQEFCFLILF